MKPKYKYNVYKIYYEHNREIKKFLGSTLAVSDKQAINNIKFRTGNDFKNAFSTNYYYSKWVAERRYE